jgi:hypothetical protein
LYETEEYPIIEDTTIDMTPEVEEPSTSPSIITTFLTGLAFGITLHFAIPLAIDYFTSIETLVPVFLSSTFFIKHNNGFFPLVEATLIDKFLKLIMKDYYLFEFGLTDPNSRISMKQLLQNILTVAAALSVFKSILCTHLALILEIREVFCKLFYTASINLKGGYIKYMISCLA